MGLIQKILSDRRIIFPIIFCLVGYPLIYPIGLPLDVSPDTRAVYRAIGSLPAGSVIVQTNDVIFASWGELGDVAKVLFRYELSRNLKVILIEFGQSAQGTTLAEIFLSQIQIPADKKYGVDYVNLGFIPGEEGALAAWAKDIHQVSIKDARGTPISQLPIMQNVKTIKDIAFWMSVNVYGGILPEMYLRQIQLIYKTPMACATIGVMYPTIKPFVSSGQLIGLMNSQRGAAEFEFLSGILGLAAATMDSQSLVHLFVIAVTLIGNVMFVASKYGGKKQ